MSLRKRLIDLAGGAGLAVHSVLGPTNSAERDTPQAQTIPDRDYEGVTRSKGGAFKPADEAREDVWRVQSRSSAEANHLFYGSSDPKAVAKGQGLGSFDALAGDGPTWDALQEAELKAKGGVAGATAANDAEWERRRARIAAAGRLHAETVSDHPAARAQRTGTTEAEVNRVLGNGAAHTCHDRPTEICTACLESNR